MYHVGNDKRKQQSARLIYQGMTNLLATTPFETITITMLTQRAGVGRATFYRLFDDKGDVLLYQMNQQFDAIVAQTSWQTSTQTVMTALMQGWLDQKPLFNALMAAKLFDQFQQMVAELLADKLGFLRESGHIAQRDWRYFIEVRSAMMMTGLRVAMTVFPDDSPAEVVAELNGLFGEPPVLDQMRQAGTRLTHEAQPKTNDEN
ncbi:hypothetical protein AYR62_12550 [Secundilactobacillus paracollinoides]|uniref:HTH tetR-type domain-containing protein n=2 Tax=Secundilactobacillus paracollinoides TaxID=240427 RepID=A0A1B2IWC6_9LACO|nr:hypothetical protein AYR61_03585 [Secundilactobacillus paracollinoides]ANZ64827.1 hypothetical protein AYR62_12550 [Secundilactobacillus paracollinoides]ANZ66343.1 hypothetical protein AYR63_03780 [Secundilactobacillus paracollinoides]